MTRLRWRRSLLFAMTLLSAGKLSHASDHLDAPMVAEDGASDVNDLYVFQSPTNPNHTVLIMTVNPFAGILSSTQFGSQVAYELLVDNNGDAQPDVTYATTFGTDAGDGTQSLTVTRGGNGSYAMGNTESDIATSGGGMVRAGLFDDPFFFDLNGFRNGLAFTGDDAFAGANISAIVLEVPNSELGGPNVGIWARTVVGGSQVDRVGRPAINTVTIPSSRKDEFNMTTPDMDFVNFGDNVRSAITSLSGNAAHASSLTSVLLPDLLTFNTANGSGFLNGRQLADDVIDAELSLLTNGAFTAGDGVAANDAPFRNVFPYLAGPNAIVPEPASTMLVITALSCVILYRRRTQQ